MKKFIIIAITMTAFSFGALAGEGCADKDKAGAGCPASKDKCPSSGETAKKDAGSKPAEAPKGDQKKS